MGALYRLALVPCNGEPMRHNAAVRAVLLAAAAEGQPRPVRARALGALGGLGAAESNKQRIWRDADVRASLLRATAPAGARVVRESAFGALMSLSYHEPAQEDRLRGEPGRSCQQQQYGQASGQPPSRTAVTTMVRRNSQLPSTPAAELLTLRQTFSLPADMRGDGDGAVGSPLR